MDPDELRALRQKRGWTLQDVATVLGVTTATLSRWERGLQIPSDHARRVWEQVLTRQKASPSDEPRRARRRPRGVIPRLAELFLADVRAGIGGRDAGWRDLTEVGLTRDDARTLAADVELRGSNQVRISFNSRLPAVEQAKNILFYTKTVQTEQRLLLPALGRRVRPLIAAAGDASQCGPILQLGLTEMVRAAAPLVETARSVFHNDENVDPTDLAIAPAGAASVILDAVNIEPCRDVHCVLSRVGFSESNIQALANDRTAEAAAVARTLGTDVVAAQLGRETIMALGASWAANALLSQEGVAIMTDVGLRYFAQAFWSEIGISRVEVESSWRRLMIDADEAGNAKHQLGMLIWTWPEEL